MKKTKVVFVSNVMSHHQAPISLEMAKKWDYTFIATKNNGLIYENGKEIDENKKFDFIIRSYESDECYNEALKKANIDIQLLGIGGNGHIGFNEPGTSFEQETFVVTLAERTREDNKRFFNSIDEVPTHAVTMGIKNIMQAKSILMLISGEAKADTVVRLLSGEVSTDFPASILYRHEDVTIIVDEAAYSKMNK